MIGSKALVARYITPVLSTGHQHAGPWKSGAVGKFHTVVEFPYQDFRLIPIMGIYILLAGRVIYWHSVGGLPRLMSLRFKWDNLWSLDSVCNEFPPSFVSHSVLPHIQACRFESRYIYIYALVFCTRESPSLSKEVQISLSGQRWKCTISFFLHEE